MKDWDKGMARIVQQEELTLIEIQMLHRYYWQEVYNRDFQVQALRTAIYHRLSGVNK